jgi:hypothetical protein
MDLHGRWRMRKSWTIINWTRPSIILFALLLLHMYLPAQKTLLSNLILKKVYRLLIPWDPQTKTHVNFNLFYFILLSPYHVYSFTHSLLSLSHRQRYSLLRTKYSFLPFFNLHVNGYTREATMHRYPAHFLRLCFYFRLSHLQALLLHESSAFGTIIVLIEQKKFNLCFKSCQSV